MDALDLDTLALDDLVLPLHSQKASLATVGGKGANLSQLVRAGFPVPTGFLVSTAAYRAFVQDNDLQQQIVARARSGVATDFEDVSAAIRQLFERASIPAKVATAIQQSYAALGMEGKAPVPLAVRSSATAEDLPGASFAGQQETYLNVHGEQALLQAVKRCWSSLWTPRALAYRAHQGIDPATVSLADAVAGSTGTNVLRMCPTRCSHASGISKARKTPPGRSTRAISAKARSCSSFERK